MSIKDRRVDVRCHMNTSAKYKYNFGCTRCYSKLQKILNVRAIRKKWGSYRSFGYFIRAIDDMDYKAKYNMEC